MKPEVARAAAQFMLRADLKGADVPAFVTVMDALQKIVDDEAADGAQPGVVEVTENESE